MIWTEAFLVPSIRISAVTAASNICLEPNSMAFMVTLLEALLADDACRVLLAIFAFPSDISRLQRLGAHSHASELVR